VTDGRQVGWHDLGCWKVFVCEPVDFGDFAISAAVRGAEVSMENDANKLDRMPVRVATDLGFWVAQDGDYSIEFDVAAQFLEAFSTSAVGEGLSGFEFATG
jgi:hypothetical protein